MFTRKRPPDREAPAREVGLDGQQAPVGIQIVDFLFHRCALLGYSNHHFAQARDVDLQIPEVPPVVIDA
jgi:hypothetical protein